MKSSSNVNICNNCTLEIIARCPDIPNPEHGHVSFDHQPLAPFIRGTRATYSCDLGYGLDGGDEMRTCEMDGFSSDAFWSGTEPSCIGMQVTILQ